MSSPRHGLQNGLLKVPRKTKQKNSTLWEWDEPLNFVVGGGGGDTTIYVKRMQPFFRITLWPV